jgi:hypothetical protein
MSVSRFAVTVIPDFRAPNVLDLELQEQQLTGEVARFQAVYDKQKEKLDSMSPGRNKGMQGRALAQIGAKKRKVEDDLRQVQVQLERAYQSHDFADVLDEVTLHQKMAYSYDRR